MLEILIIATINIIGIFLCHRATLHKPITPRALYRSIVEKPYSVSSPSKRAEIKRRLAALTK